LYARVSYSRPVYGIQSSVKPDLTGVKVFLSDGENELQFFQKNDSFILDIKSSPVLFNKYYTLKVTDNLGNIATSTCLLPPVNNYNLNVDTTFTMSSNEWGPEKHLSFTTKISNLNPENAYYRVMYYYDVFERDFYDNTLQVHNHSKLADSYYYNQTGKSSVELNLLHDQYEYWNYGSGIDSVFLKIKVLQYNEDYYFYKKSLENYTDEDSYFTELSPIFSNISGGLGFFGGYTVREYSFKLNKVMVEYK
jgi:hypothetical protein